MNNKDKELRAAYYRKHKEELLAKRKQYYKAHKDEISEKNKQKYKEDKKLKCQKAKEYYHNHKEECAKRHKDYYDSHKEIILADMASYYKDNAEEKRTKVKNYRDANSEIIKERRRTAYKTKKEDALFRFIHGLRNNISYAFKRACTPKEEHTLEILGCSIEEFRNYISSKFQDGMTFDNYGEWHLDHIIPISSAKSFEEVKKLCHYSNYQPLWAFDNISKGNKILNYNGEEES